MNGIVNFRLCTLSDLELIKKVDQLTDDLFGNENNQKRENVLIRHIPAQPNNDYDLLIGELILRFKEVKKL
jgi:hypothetical protein